MPQKDLNMTNGAPSGAPHFVMTRSLWLSVYKCTELVAFSSLVTLQNKKRKVAQPQVTRGTSSPDGLCSRATFRQSQYQTCTIVDRSSLTSALISACPLAASDVGSSDRRTNDLGALFVSVSVLYHIVYLFSRTNR